MFIRLGLLLLFAVCSQARLNQGSAFATNQQLNETPDINPHITFGQNAKRGQFPYQVGIYTEKLIFCGGSLIDQNWILTAGYCVDKMKIFTIHFGAYDINNDDEPGHTVRVTRTSFTHENYNETTYDNDVGLIKLEEPIGLTDVIAVIPLPPRSFNNRDFNGQAVRVSGWGKIQNSENPLNPELQWVDLTVINNDECKKTYPNIVTDKIVCTSGPGGKGTCFGDTGGPLVIMGNETTKTTLFAVVSFVKEGNDCTSEKPSAFDRVYKFLDWIHNKTGLPIQD